MSANNLPNFIVNTEYAALKGFPATITINVNISAGGTLPAGNYNTNQTLVTPVGITIPKGAPLQVEILTSISPTYAFQETVLQFVENNGGANQYQGIILVSLNDANQISVNISLFNGNGYSVSTVARAITVRIRWFEPPFN